MADPMADKDSSSTTKNSNDNAIIATVFLASHLLVWIYTDRLFMKEGLDWLLKYNCSALESLGYSHATCQMLFSIDRRQNGRLRHHLVM